MEVLIVGGSLSKFDREIAAAKIALARANVKIFEVSEAIKALGEVMRTELNDIEESVLELSRIMRDIDYEELYALKKSNFLFYDVEDFIKMKEHQIKVELSRVFNIYLPLFRLRAGISMSGWLARKGRLRRRGKA